MPRREPRRTEAHTSNRFNPFAGFLGAATFEGIAWEYAASGFNPFAGFLGAATPRVRGGPRARRGVSIPSRVFWVLRHIDPEDGALGKMFQSLRGFSGCCDGGVGHLQVATRGGFNPFAGFLGAATRRGTRFHAERHEFQSLRGFSGCCDMTSIWSSTAASKFQSLRGFSGCCDVVPPPPPPDVASFQSLRGFSGCCDACSRPSTTTTTGFNPFAGFLGAATRQLHAIGKELDEFQSLRGFSGCCDTSTRTIFMLLNSRFNPFAGFLGAATRVDDRACNDGSHVSIPSRVFWVLRPDRPQVRPVTWVCFNPFAGFLGAATREKLRRERDVLRFNPFAGFLGAATPRPGAGRECPRPSFNPFAGFLGAATVIQGTHNFAVMVVSIPSRVFWVLRQKGRAGVQR